MSQYIDGYILPVRKDRISAYKAMAEKAAVVWKEHGALAYWESVGDDLQSEWARSFADLANASEEETVMFSWAVFESREARDAANEKIMADPRMLDLMDTDNPLFDCRRMAQGGFTVLVSE